VKVGSSLKRCPYISSPFKGEDKVENPARGGVRVNIPSFSPSLFLSPQWGERINENVLLS